MTIMSNNVTNPNCQNLKLGDTTLTKVFVGGLAWETQREALRAHFEKYGEILEAVIILDKASGRSKGYGFVTFEEAEAAKKACENASPIINGRRANCNIASLGAKRPRATPPSPHPISPTHQGGVNLVGARAHVRWFYPPPSQFHQPLISYYGYPSPYITPDMSYNHIGYMKGQVYPPMYYNGSQRMGIFPTTVTPFITNPTSIAAPNPNTGTTFGWSSLREPITITKGG